MNPLSRRAGAARVEVVRTFALDDMTIRRDGTGRTVEAYAAVFDQEIEVSDFEGDRYVEIIRRGTFNRTLNDKRARAGLQVIYNHGLDIYGTPSDRFALPLGTLLEAREDGRGLFTVVEYARTPLADEVLELIRAGAIRSQSVGGRWQRSNPQQGPYRPGQRVERFEMRLREFGPTPFPVYQDAAVVGVRSVQDIVRDFAALSAEDRAELARLLSTPPDDPDAPDAGAAGGGDQEPPGQDPEPPAAATTPADDPELELELLRRQLRL